MSDKSLMLFGYWAYVCYDLSASTPPNSVETVRTIGESMKR